jgi:RNA-directed DNA polymerase
MLSSIEVSRHSGWHPDVLHHISPENTYPRTCSIKHVLGFTHISGKDRLGRFSVRRLTIRKRMRRKLREIKQQLRQRMHDPLRQTGEWLKSVVHGYFNYYAVPGNIGSLSLFRDRLLGLWWHTLCRRSQQRLPWEKMLGLGDRWLPRPRVLHPYPVKRFAASHPR